MPKSHEDPDNYSLVIYQSRKNREKVYLGLRKGGKIVNDKDYKIYGRFRDVGLRALLIVHYARAKKVNFKAAWDSDEVWR